MTEQNGKNPGFAPGQQNEAQIANRSRFRVGLFTLLGLLLIAAVTVYVNDRPFWWRACQVVFINIEDATGLKSKSPVRSLGLDIGYLKTVELHEKHVRLGICITAPVDVLPETKAYIRGEGFLGDKFVELKPVRYNGSKQGTHGTVVPMPIPLGALLSLWPGEASAAPQKAKPGASRDIPVGSSSQDVQEIVGQVDELVGEMRALTNNLKQSIDPQELKNTITQLNQVLSSASKTLSPQGQLTTTAQRALAKLEDGIEQMRDLLTRVNQGEGSVGMLLTDRKYADQIEEALINVNRLLSKVRGIRFVVDVGAEQIPTLENGSRGWFKLGIWPERDRYYLLGVALDYRGKVTTTELTTISGGSSSTIRSIQVEESGLLFTAMLGKVYWKRLDLAVGFLHGDAAASGRIYLWKNGRENHVEVGAELYAENNALTGNYQYHLRPTVVIRPWNTLYLKAGLESLKKIEGETPLLIGAGLSFDDEDIKFLFSFL